MSIKPPPKPSDDKKLAEFINAAPDGATPAQLGQAGRGRPRKERGSADDTMVQIALRLTQGDLDRIDEAAAAQRISRAGYIRQAVFKSIDGA